jgi:hypothetical protein
MSTSLRETTRASHGWLDSTQTTVSWFSATALRKIPPSAYASGLTRAVQCPNSNKKFSHEKPHRDLENACVHFGSDRPSRFPGCRQDIVGRTPVTRLWVWWQSEDLAEIRSCSMRRSHRSVHRALWPVLALAVGLGFVIALALRAPPPAEAPPAQPRASDERSLPRGAMESRQARL